MDWEFGVNRCRLLPLEQISNEILWCRSQMRLRSDIAVTLVQAGSNSSDQTPSLGNSVCRGCGRKRTKDKRQKTKKSDQIQFPVLYSRISLLIYSKCSSLHPLTPDSQSFPFPRLPLGSHKSIFQVHDFLFCGKVHLCRILDSRYK